MAPRVCVWSLCVSVAAVAVSVSRAAVQKAEVLALSDLYGTTRGAGWLNSTNWLAGDPCGHQWYGVECDYSGSHVVYL